MAAYLFDGVDDSLTADAVPLSAYPFTIGVWFRVADITNPHALAGFVDKDDEHVLQYVIASGSATGDPIRAASRLTLGGAQVQADTTAGYTANTWQSAVGVFAAADDRRAFLDGANKGTNADSMLIGAIDRTFVGRLMDSTPSAPLTGHIGYVFIWNVALSDAEVADWDAGNIPQQANLVAFYDLTTDHGVGPVPDEVGTLDLTVNGATFDAAQTPPVTYSLGPVVPAVDPYGGATAGIRAPANNAVAVTPDDVNELAFVTRGLYVGGTGDVTVLMADGETATFAGVQAGSVLSLRVRRVNESGTTATGIRALW